MHQMIIQVLMAMLGVIGFSIMFNIHGYKVFIIAVCGTVCWIVYIVLFHFSNDKVISYFFTTIIMAALSEVLARIIKTPVILLFVPIIVPLIPGSDLYYMMFHFVLGNASEGRNFGYLLAKEAGAIGFGIIIVTTVTQTLFVIYNNLEAKLNK